jgi:lipoate-protein ligase A
MAVDEAILHALARGQSRPTVRLFAWDPPCLTLGYNQHWHEVDLPALAQQGYTWTRRPTGGKAILHTDEATYSLIIPQDDPRIHGGVVESYRVLSLGLLRALALLGVSAVQANPAAPLPGPAPDGTGGPVCFDTPSRYEITWQGRKLIGSAQLRRQRIVLQHGSLPLHGNLNRILDVLAFSNEDRANQARILPQRAATLENALSRVVSFAEAAAALAQGFAHQFNISLEEAPLTPLEEELAHQLRAEQYANEAWLKRV